MLADHEHSLSEVIVSRPLPPDEGSSGTLFDRETWHLDAVGPVTFVAVDDPHAASANAAHASNSAGHWRR